VSVTPLTKNRVARRRERGGERVVDRLAVDERVAEARHEKQAVVDRERDDERHHEAERGAHDVEHQRAKVHQAKGGEAGDDERREDEQQHAQRAHHEGEHGEGERNDNTVAERHVVLDRGLDGRHEGVVAHHLEAERGARRAVGPERTVDLVLQVVRKVLAR
jgi:hypothetical protein